MVDSLHIFSSKLTPITEEQVPFQGQELVTWHETTTKSNDHLNAAKRETRRHELSWKTYPSKGEDGRLPTIIFQGLSCSVFLGGI